MDAVRSRPRFHWPWPLPAVAAWAACWAVFAALSRLVGAPLAAIGAGLLGLLMARAAPTPWRRRIVAGGFPLAVLLVNGPASIPLWIWPAALAAAWLLYPRRAWRDAPLYPTPAGALRSLAARLPGPPPARMLDAGSGAGHGLRALHEAWPQARIDGVEWSWPLVLWSRATCRFAHVRRGDLWSTSWSGCDLVYLFQRPESMARAWAKAGREMAPGSWLVSLEFGLPDRPADLQLASPCGRPVHAWRVGAQSGADSADNPG